MNIIDEARRRYQATEIDPITADADNPDFDAAQAQEMVDKILSIGQQREQALDTVLDRSRDAVYWIPNANTGDYADFDTIANYNYLKKKYPWLHTKHEQIGIDVDEAIDSHGDFESFLGSIAHEDWESFMEEMAQYKDCDHCECFDDDGAMHLEMEETSRWIKEDGGPDLIKAMVEDAEDAYEGYLLAKTTQDMILEWMRECDHYPERDGQGGVWLDMEKQAADEENRDWFLDQIPDDVEGWTQVRRESYEAVVGGDGKATIADLFYHALRVMGQEDEQVAHAFNRVDDDILWKMFLEAFPDERREDGDPGWYFWKPLYNEPGNWRPGIEIDKGYEDEWIKGFGLALETLKRKQWFRNVIANWFERGPESHPEFKFEHLREDRGNPDDLDDPETFMRYGGGLAEELVYEDAKIKVMYPRDFHTLNHHLRMNGLQEIDKKIWNEIFSDRDIFVVIAKEDVDLMGHTAQRELGIIIANEAYGVTVYAGTSARKDLRSLLTDPQYGKSIKRMLLQFYREDVQRNSALGKVLLQLGGPLEIRRAARKGHVDEADYTLALGLYYVDKRRYDLAAKTLNRSRETILPKGVWLKFKDVSALEPVFRNEKTAEAVFSGDTDNYFDHYYDDSNTPKVSDVIKFLDQKAIDHIRSVMVNRRVWFPEGGADGTGAYGILRAKDLAVVSDKDMLDWLVYPGEEDTEIEAFGDIIEALQRDGTEMLVRASQDNLYTAFVKAAVKAVDGTQHAWSETFDVFTPWVAVKEWGSKHDEEYSYPFNGALEDLAVDMNRKTVEPDVDMCQADWGDINKRYAAENLYHIYELDAPEPPEPVYGEPAYNDPKQILLPLPENIDDPSAMPRALSGVPVELEKSVRTYITDTALKWGASVSDIRVELESTNASEYRLLNVNFRVDDARDLDLGRCGMWSSLLPAIGTYAEHAFHDMTVRQMHMEDGTSEQRVWFKVVLELNEPLNL